jgi:hypothetical protein
MINSRHLVIIDRLRKLTLINPQEYTYDEYKLVCEIEALLERSISCQNGSSLNFPAAYAEHANSLSRLEAKLNGIAEVLHSTNVTGQ